MPRFGRALAFLLPCLTACDAGIEPGGPPAIDVRADQTLDGVAFTTSDAAVTLSTSQGGPLAFTRVALRLPPFTINAGGFCGRDALTRELVDTTDDRGALRFCYRRSGRAGVDTITVEVPDRSLVGTLVARVSPAEPVMLELAPLDTALYAGRSVEVKSTGIDGFGNTFPVEPVLAVAGPGSRSGTRVTASAFGRIVITARLGALEARSGISVVPVGRIVALADENLGASSRVVGVALDGSGFQQLSSAVGAQAWTGLALSPDGRDVYFATGGGGTGPRRLVRQRLGSTAAPVRVTTQGDTGPSEELPQVAARTGQVFLTLSGTAPSSMHVVTGTGAVVAFGPVGTTGTSSSPAPSPDGARVAFVLDEGTGPMLRVLTRATGVMDAWRIEGATSPSWSPDGTRIAFVRGGSLGLVNPDGSGLRLFPWAGDVLQGFHGPIAWSPDGRYLLCALWPGGAGLQVVRVEDGVTARLGQWPFIGRAAWRP